MGRGRWKAQANKKKVQHQDKHLPEQVEDSQPAADREKHSKSNLKEAVGQDHVIKMAEKSLHKRMAKSDSKNHANGTDILFSKSLKAKLHEKDERESLVLWKRPIVTLQYFCIECYTLLMEYLTRLWNNKDYVAVTLLVLAGLYVTTQIPGPHQIVLQQIYQNFWWCGWWVWLGILSSVGLGTGLHTFLLYLGPHIASVTMAAYSCNSVDFPSPPYPDEIICPEKENLGVLSVFNIISKVRLEAFMWGAGTALGELPPYFMARGARLSGSESGDEEMAEFEALQRLKERPEDMSWLDRAKVSVEKMVERVGFFGIMACASIPNPLFDLAGITCGHFLVPFWTFFGATLIGKAIIKMHIQKMFVIIAFNESLLERAVDYLACIPLVGRKLQEPFKVFLEKQKLKFRRKSGSSSDATDRGNLIAWLFEKLIMAMIFYFILSIINSFAQNYHKRLKKQKERKK